MTEEQALRQLKQGSQEALAWFIDRYGAYAAAIVRNVMGAYMTDADVEEAVSDVFLGFWNNAGQVRGGAVKAYLGAAARNSAKNKLRQACRTVPLPEDAVLETGDRSYYFIKREAVCMGGQLLYYTGVMKRLQEGSYEVDNGSGDAGTGEAAG